MPLISSTGGKVLTILVGVLLVLCMGFGVLAWYRGDVIDSQKTELAQQKEALDRFEKDKAAQDVADKQLQADKDKIAKERNKLKAQLNDALKDDGCADTALPDNSKWVLDELYGRESSK